MFRLVCMTAIFILFSFFSFSQSRLSDCNKFRTGQFAYITDSSETVIIKRTTKRQEETVQNTSVVTKFRIKWISDCEYELKQTWSNSKAKRKFNKGVTRVRITKVDGNYYHYTCDCKETTTESSAKSGIVRKIK